MNNYEIDEAIDKFYEYYKGRNGAQIDFDKAYQIALKIAKHRTLLGNHLIGICNQYGVGVEPNIQEAIRLFQINVDNDNDTSMVQLGLIYKNSKLIKHDYEKAFKLFTRAAELGNTDAMKILGNMYSNDLKEDAIPIDFDKAAHYYKLAADNGDKLAAEKFANLLMNGIIPQNKEEALKYYGMASSEIAQMKIQMINHKGNQKELMQIVNEKFATPLKRLDKNAASIDWKWGKVFYFG